MNLIKYLYRLSRLIIKKTMTFLLSILYIGWPKDKSLILFSQANSRYSGNSRELFEFLCKKKLNVIWLYTDEYQRNSAGSEFHNNFIKRNSLQGFILTLKAKKIVISYAGSDFGWYWLYLKSSIVISLWHAIMIKHVALLDNKFTSRMISEYLKNETYYYTYQMVSSDVDRYLTSSSHGIDVRKVLPLGNPKTDKYIRLSKLHQVENSILKRSKKILYAPTFRDYKMEKDLFFPFFDFDEDKLINFFVDQPSLEIYLRPHPGDLESNRQAKYLEELLPDKIVYYSQQVCDDIDEVLYQFDIIITDYSSIYIEPLLSNTPCIFVPFDYDRYMETRGLAYDYEMVTPGPQVKSFTELLEAIEDALIGAEEWKDKRKLVTDIFFKYKDANACERIATQVLGLDISTDELEKIDK